MRIALTMTAASLATALAGCCGYGGPGCGDPGVLGLCNAQVSDLTRATLVYFDDTGEHPSDFGSVEASPPERLVAQPGQEKGEIVLVGHEPGAAQLSVGDIPGWGSEIFVYKLHVVDVIDERSCGEVPQVLSPVEGAGP